MKSNLAKEPASVLLGMMVTVRSAILVREDVYYKSIAFWKNYVFN